MAANHDQERRQANLKLVRKYFETVPGSDARHDLYAENLHVTVQFAPPKGPSEWRSKADFIAMTRYTVSLLKDVGRTDLQIHEALDPDRFFVTCGYEGTMIATGLPYRNQFVYHFHVANGKLAELFEYYNPLPLMKAGLRAKWE